MVTLEDQSVGGEQQGGGLPAPDAGGAVVRGAWPGSGRGGVGRGARPGRHSGAPPARRRFLDPWRPWRVSQRSSLPRRPRLIPGWPGSVLGARSTSRCTATYGRSGQPASATQRHGPRPFERQLEGQRLAYARKADGLPNVGVFGAGAPRRGPLTSSSSRPPACMATWVHAVWEGLFPAQHATESVSIVWLLSSRRCAAAWRIVATMPTTRPRKPSVRGEAGPPTYRARPLARPSAAKLSRRR